jgi:N-acetylglucosaminyldiphosphoundecaprenol N-acetyl-beta-D-mannosaminyltransferase
MDLLKNAIEVSFPGVIIAGALVPPFGHVDDYDFEGWSRFVIDSGAGIVWVGLGSPKQDYVTARLSTLTGKTAVGIGAAFAFLAGTQSEAPKVLQSVGLEWLFRLLTEPRRLWRRYAFGVGVYSVLCARDLLQNLYVKSLRRE